MSDDFLPRFRHALEQWSSGDADDHGLGALGDVLADDVVWHLAGDERPIRGRDAVLERLRADLDVVEVDADVHDVLANDEHAMALLQVHLRRGDRQVGYAAVEIVHHDGERVTERWAIVSNLQAVAAFWKP